MKTPHATVPASYLILEKEGEILLIRRQGSGYYDGWYSVPAGHVEEGELPIECLIREVKEEIGIDLDKKDVKLVHTMYRTKNDPTGDRADYFFSATKWNGEPKNCEEDKCDDLQWFPLSELPKNTVHHVRKAIKCVQKGVVHSELGKDEVTANPTGE